MPNFFTKIISSFTNKEVKPELKVEIQLENKNMKDDLFDFKIDERDRLKHGWDEVFYATFSDDLNKMLRVVDMKTIPINRHHLLQTIVNHSYKLRKEDKYREMCLKYAEQHLKEFDEK